MNKTNLLSVFATLLIVQILGFISINYLGDYGWSVFLFLPFVIGFLPPFISGKKTEITKGTAYKLSFIALGLACLVLLVFAIEGLICLLMASPLLILAVWIGSYIGYKSSDTNFMNPTNTTVILALLSFGFTSFDYFNKPTDLIPIRTTIVIDAPIEKVWNNVITFDKIDAPTDWIFKTGIAYPTDATIIGKGVGAVRYCNFTTGSFIEPITVWNEPNLLQFDVQEQPTPMNELNPFWEVHPPHLDGYFKSYKGQFKLTKLSENQTELEGTTWYKVDIYPEIYWKSWSDFIVHKIHKRVLNHIKHASEQ